MTGVNKTGATIGASKKPINVRLIEFFMALSFCESSR